MTEQKIRVLIADDFDIMRQVMQMLLERAEIVTVIDEAPRLEDAIIKAQETEPDVILMNDYLPPIDSAHATEKFRQAGITSPILVVSMTLEPNLIRHSLAAGVNGYMHKDEMLTYLIDAVSQLHAGKQFVSPAARTALADAEEQ